MTKKNRTWLFALAGVASLSVVTLFSVATFQGSRIGFLSNADLEYSMILGHDTELLSPFSYKENPRNESGIRFFGKPYSGKTRRTAPGRTLTTKLLPLTISPSTQTSKSAGETILISFARR